MKYTSEWKTWDNPEVWLGDDVTSHLAQNGSPSLWTGIGVAISTALGQAPDSSQGTSLFTGSWNDTADRMTCNIDDFLHPHAELDKLYYLTIRHKNSVANTNKFTVYVLDSDGHSVDNITWDSSTTYESTVLKFYYSRGMKLSFQCLNTDGTNLYIYDISCALAPKEVSLVKHHIGDVYYCDWTVVATPHGSEPDTVATPPIPWTDAQDALVSFNFYNAGIGSTGAGGGISLDAAMQSSVHRSGYGPEILTNGGFDTDVSVYGPELAINGGFDTDSVWDASDDGWSISDGKARCDGTQSIDGKDVNQDGMSVSIGKSYKITADVTVDAGNYKFVVGGTTNTGYSNETGSVVNYLTVAGTENEYIHVVADANFVGTIDNYSIKEVHGGGWKKAGPVSVADGFGFLGVSASTSSLKQLGVLTVARKYSYTIIAKSANDGTLKISDGVTTHVTIEDVPTTFTAYTGSFIASGTELSLSEAATGDIYIDSVSIKEVFDWSDDATPVDERTSIFATDGIAAGTPAIAKNYAISDAIGGLAHHKYVPMKFDNEDGVAVGGIEPLTRARIIFKLDGADSASSGVAGGEKFRVLIIKQPISSSLDIG